MRITFTKLSIALVVSTVLLSGCGIEAVGIAGAETERAVVEVQRGQALTEQVNELSDSLEGQGSGRVPSAKYACPEDANEMAELMAYTTGISKLDEAEATAAKSLYRAAALCGDSEISSRWIVWSSN